jgi:hypothetical protein
LLAGIFMVNLFYARSWITSAISLTVATCSGTVYVNFYYTIDISKGVWNVIVDRLVFALLPVMGITSFTLACYANENNIRRMFFLLDKAQYVLLLSLRLEQSRTQTTVAELAERGGDPFRLSAGVLE